MYIYSLCSNKIFLFLILFVIASCCISSSHQYDKICTINDGQINMTYQHQITDGSPVTYIYPLDPYLIRNPSGVSIHIEASAGRTADLECPLLFTIGQFHEMTNFQLPFAFKGDSELHFNAGRTLCMPLNVTGRARTISVRVSTCSSTRVFFDFRLSMTFDTLRTDGSVTTAQITPTKPTFFKYVFDNHEKIRIVRLSASSDDKQCMTLSVQDLHCPIYDKEHNVEHTGFWQTITTKGAMAISKKDFPEGFVVVLVLHHDNRRCSLGSTLMSDRRNMLDSGMRKDVKLTLRIERDVPGGSFFLALIIPVFGTFLAVICTCLLFRNRHNWLHQSTKNAFMLDKIRSVENQLNRDSSIIVSENGRMLETDLDVIPEEETEGSIGNSYPNETRNEVLEPIRRAQSFPSHLEDPSELPPPSNNIWQWKASLNIASLQSKDHERLMKSSNRFYWTVVIVSVFYAIPVYQLILHYLRVVNRTGEFDICYYNYLCSYRLWIFSDFNHFWSNISYVLFGVSFIFIVGRRERNMRLHKVEKKDGRSMGYFNMNDDESKLKNLCTCAWLPDRCLSCCCAPIINTRIDHGIPVHFGVFYAMGLALIMEGFLSAAYHLCPNQSNFQFDTCFMYVIAVLTILKIYQFRHPIHLGANQIFGILAAFVSASVIGLILEVYDSSSTVLTLFRWLFYIGLLISMLCMSVHFYAIGYIKDTGKCTETEIMKEIENGQVLGSIDVLTNLNQLPRTVQVDRLLLPVISLSLSIIIIIYAEISKIHFATYLLYTLIGNVFGTSIYYIGIMKPLHGEFKNWTWVQPVIYFVTSLVVGVIAIYYFLNVLTMWEVSPSASRAINEECTQSWFPFLPFYDNHDIWHFLSAGALFFSFMGLLIVDDDLVTTPQKNIPVF